MYVLTQVFMSILKLEQRVDIEDYTRLPFRILYRQLLLIVHSHNSAQVLKCS